MTLDISYYVGHPDHIQVNFKEGHSLQFMVTDSQQHRVKAFCTVTLVHCGNTVQQQVEIGT